MEVLDGDSLMAWLILVLIAIYPSELGEVDGTLPQPGPHGGTWKTAAPPPRPKLKSQGYGKLKREIFLQQFTAQAGPKLMPCLRDTFGQSASLSFLARLHKNGSLSAVRILNAAATSSECARQEIEKMKFPGLGSELTEDDLEISWRFDY